MPDIVALDKYPCAACGAQAEWNPSKQLLVCPFCGTAAPFSVDAASGAMVEHDLAKALRELPDEARGWLVDKRTVQCQSCKAVSVFDPERVGQNCSFCGSPSLVDYTEIKAPIRPQSLLPFKISEGAGPRADPAMVCEQVAGARQAQEPRARGSRPRRLHSVLDVRRAGGVPVGSGGGPLLLHDRIVPRPERPLADAAGAARPLGTGLRRRHALFRRRARAGHARRLARVVEGGRAVPHVGAGAVRHRVPLGVRRGALSDRAPRCGAEFTGVDDAPAAARCARLRCRATRTATWRSTRRSRRRRSSTYWYRSGCSRISTVRRRIRSS